MAARLVIVLEAGTPRAGLWCDTCLLPSRAELDVLALDESGVSPFARYSMCTNHEKEAHRVGL